MQAASPSFGDLSAWSAQPCDDPRMSPQALIGDEFGDDEQYGSETGDRYQGDSECVGQRQSGSLLNDNEVPVGDTRRRGGARIWRRRPLEEFELEDIKLKYAQGISTAQIFKKHSHHAVHNFRNRVRSKWGSWTSRQDQELLRLYEEKGDDWAEISKKLSGVSRNADEVRVRLERLDKREREGGKQRRESRGRHQYREEEDDDIKLQLAQGISCGELAKQSKYRHLHGKNIKRHAKIIGASWDEDDDEKLQENVMKYGNCDMDIDWGFVGEQYNPPRDAELVATRWGHIQGRYNNMKEFESEMSDGAGGHAQVDQSSQIQQYSGFYDQPSSQAYPENTSKYPTAGPYSFQPAAITQSLADVNTSSVPRYGSAHIYLRDAYNDPANPNPRSSYARHTANAGYRTQLEEHLPEIRTKLAQDWSWEQVRKEYCPGYRYDTMRQFLRTRGCSLWYHRQDLHLLDLQRMGLDWTRICDQLTGPQRTVEEAQDRFAWLTKPDDDDDEHEE